MVWVNLMTLLGKFLVELKVLKVLLGYWGVGRRYNRDVGMRVWWAVFYKRFFGIWIE